VLERLAKQIPLPCYGTEQDLADARCKACEWQKPCLAAHGRRAGRVKLTQATFALVPELLALRLPSDPDEADLEAAYWRCHRLVFDSDPPDKLGRWPTAGQKLSAICHESRCSLETAITAVMMAHREANPDRPFYSNMLIGPSAARRVELYRDACRGQYGHFDAKSLGLLTRTSRTTLADRMLASECLFGEFIVASKARLEGPAPAIQEFYQARELALDPFWLAIEPSYQPVILRHVEEETGTTQLRRHRLHVVQAIAELKRGKEKATRVFLARQEVAPMAVEIVVSRSGISSRSLELEPRPVTSMSHLWLRIGLAIQHLRLLKFYGETQRHHE
jgi:hypothetical protein